MKNVTKCTLDNAMTDEQRVQSEVCMGGWTDKWMEGWKDGRKKEKV